MKLDIGEIDIIQIHISGNKKKKMQQLVKV